MRDMDTIRQASTVDIPHLIDLLHQVNRVHHHLRPELFKPDTTKYSEQELERLLGDKSKPIGKTLFEFVRDYAKSIDCHAVTLNVWEGNDSAIRFYQNICGL